MVSASDVQGNDDFYWMIRAQTDASQASAKGCTRACVSLELSVTAHISSLHPADGDSETESNDDDSSSNVAETATADVPAPAAAAPDNCCKVCLIAERDACIALVPCGHARFCAQYATTVNEQGDRRCPVQYVAVIFRCCCVCSKINGTLIQFHRFVHYQHYCVSSHYT